MKINRISKRIMFFVMSFIIASIGICMPLTCSQVKASTAKEETSQDYSFTNFQEVNVSDQLNEDNEELFEEYANVKFEQKMTKVYANDIAGSKLNGLDRRMYEVLKADSLSVANGDIADTILKYSNEQVALKNKWTAEELKVESLTKDGAITEEAITALRNKWKLRMWNEEGCDNK